MNLTYSKAYAELEKLVKQIENDQIQLDTLADKVKLAKQLIYFCEKKLKTIEVKVTKAMDDKTKGQ